ncbi:hypothetical protein N3K66_007313 [Trichothecium roseum]|uniref:Uncharacterized protein n=1 Tax=Trichothecium roseum TaxID=47278 RepID=A0ACC0UU43_9HYPO|nr:hypothetical protein N3K66_007313 [Trichothecium roseum]
MDHDHGDMDPGHGDHGGHSGGGDEMCNMNMLFTWDTTNLCIVFRQWHVRSTTSLLASLVAVVLLAMGYEAIRSASRKYEAAVSRRIEALPNESVTESTPFIAAGQSQDREGQRAHVIKGLLYAFQNFYAFMLMLVFMTYNGWVMIAVSLGAFLGYVVFGHATSATKDNACH